MRARRRGDGQCGWVPQDGVFDSVANSGKEVKDESELKRTSMKLFVNSSIR